MDALAGYYAKRAPEYERIYQKPERQENLRALREFVAETFSERNVLEVACGTGYWTQAIAGTAQSVLATDINEEVLTIARAKEIRNAEFQCCDAFALPAEGNFDAGFAGFWWSHLTCSQLREFLRAFHRKLKPGSVVIFLDNIFVAGSSTPISRRDADGNTYQLRKLDDGSTTEVLKNFPTDAEVHNVLDGFAEQLLITRFQYYWHARYHVRNERRGI